VTTEPTVATASPISGGRAIAEMFRVAGAGPMFGMGGFQLLPYYDAVGELGLQHHLINDERTGCFAADAYARVTNRPGICDGTLGPGATNLVTSLVESLNAGIPLIALVGDAHRSYATNNMTQECAQTEILRPASKELIRVEDVGRIPEAVRRAFAVATAGRPGPVVIDVPEDVAHAEHQFAPSDFFVDPRTMKAPAHRARPDAHEIERAAALLSQAERPVIAVGGGIHLSEAYDALQALAEQLGAPVVHTLSGKGAIACTHPLSAGLFGRYSRIGNDLIERSDGLLVVGCKLGEIATKRYTLPPSSVPVVHLDSSAEEIGRTVTADVALWGDARSGLVDLAAAIGPASGSRAPRAEWVEEMHARLGVWREEASARLLSDEQPINVGRLVNELNHAMPAESILVADGGFAAHWTGLLYDTQSSGRTYVADRGLASIGYGLPGAIGAQLGAPDLPVVAMTGDGGFNMTLGDLETARRVGANVTVVVVNNAASGYIKALQHAMYGARYQSSDLVEMNYAGIAEAMGCRGIRVTDPGDLATALKTGIAERDLPTVIDVVVTRDPAQMLPAADSRAVKIKPGDRIA
jgi:acetolactate synthase-1/2/3 large subunit